MSFKHSLLLIITLASLPAVANVKPVAQMSDEEVFDAVSARSQQLFDLEFGQCDQGELDDLMMDDYDYLDDRWGMYENAKQKTVSACYGANNEKRELIKGSQTVHRLNMFGAVEQGSHQFYKPVEGSDGEMKLYEKAHYIHIWQYDMPEGVWRLQQAISFDHQPVEEK